MTGVIIRLLTSRVGLIGLAITIGLAVIWGAAWKAGRDSLKRYQLEQSLEAWEKRNELDDETDRLDSYDLCVALGGLPDECNRVRGLETPAETE